MKEEIVDYGNDITKIASLIADGNIVDARQVAKEMPKRIKKVKLPHSKIKSDNKDKSSARKYNETDLMNVFIKDGFIDRYTGLKLTIPPVLKLISEIIPIEFPYHPNWAEGKCHDSYWDLSATADHIKPVADNGTDDIENLVSTSMSKNLQKTSIPFDVLGWSLHKAGNINEWDGLSEFFLQQCDRNPYLLKESYFFTWYKAIKKTIPLSEIK